MSARMVQILFALGCNLKKETFGRSALELGKAFAFKHMSNLPEFFTWNSKVTRKSIGVAAAYGQRAPLVSQQYEELVCHGIHACTLMNVLL